MAVWTINRDDFPSQEDYYAALYPYPADFEEAVQNARDFDARTPDAEIEADVAARGVGPGALVNTADGGKGYACRWTRGGCWEPEILVLFALVPPGADSHLRGDYYAPEQLAPVW